MDKLVEGEYVIADKAYDADERVRNRLLKDESKVVIPSKKSRKDKKNYDKELYKSRHLIENLFCRLKQYRAIATRYDKTAQNFLGAIYLAATVIWLN
jgi:transposase